MERSGVLANTQFTYRKGLGTCDALLCVSHTLQSALESGQEARIWQIDFRQPLHDKVNHQDILYRLCSVCIGGSVLSILTQFLSNRSQHVMADGCRNKLNGKVFYGQEPLSGESTTTECGFNYQLLAVIYRSSPMGSY